MTTTIRTYLPAVLLGFAACSALGAKAVPIGDPNNPTALPAALAKAYADGAREMTITPGTYLLPASGGNPIVLDSWVDATIHAEGVTIVAANPAIRPLQLSKCERVVVKGAVIRFSSPSFTQGRIVSIQKNGQNLQVDWRIDAGYETPVGDRLIMMDVVDQNTRLLRVGTGDFDCASIDVLAPGLLRLNGVTGGFGTAQVGDWIFIRIGRGGLVHVNQCVDCSFLNLTLQNSGFAAFFETGGEGNQFVDCRIVPGPKPPGATEEQLAGCGSDGFHSVGTKVGPSIQGMVFEGVLHDDCIAIHGSFAPVFGSEGKVLLLEAGQLRGFAVGEPVRVSGPDGYHEEFLCTAMRETTRKVEYCEYTLLRRGESVPVVLTIRQGVGLEYAKNEAVRIVNGQGAAQQFECRDVRVFAREETLSELTLDRECTARFGARATNPRRAGAGYKIVNSKIGNCRSRGILVKGDNGLIEGNEISGCGMSAISIGPEFYWNEAGYCENVVVRGNTLRGNVANKSECGVVLIHGDGAIGNRAISIADNVFDRNNGRGEIRVEWTDGASITGNKFILRGEPQTEAIVNLDHSKNITFKDNSIANATAGLVPVHIGASVEGVEGNDAKGFEIQKTDNEQQ